MDYTSLTSVISCIIEICLQWLYATRKKQSIYKSLVEIILLIWFGFSLTLIWYVLEAFLLYNCIGYNSANFIRILSIVISMIVLIILLNKGTEENNYSKVLLICYYLISKRKRHRHGWIKGIVILSLIAYLVFALCQEVDIIAQALNIKLIETVIIGLVIISLFIDILLTKCIINEIKFYKVKIITSIVQFFALLVIYIASSMDMLPDELENIYDIIIFAIGQIAFAESAVSNCKSMYKKIGEEKKEEIEEYLASADKKFEEYEEKFLLNIKEIKNFARKIVDVWSKMDGKQRIKIVGVLLAIIGLYVFLTWLVTLL